jgi:uncharacterized protein YndB with AHSA1/START domain
VTEPIVMSVDVPLPAEQAFELFAERMNAWWPLDDFSMFRSEARNVVLETRAGGRIIETAADGRTTVWGEVLICEPPRRLVFTWHPNTTEQSEVEMTFESLRADETRVTLEHRGWEAFGDKAGEMREMYVNGWPFVFVERFGNAAKEMAA